MVTIRPHSVSAQLYKVFSQFLGDHSEFCGCESCITVVIATDNRSTSAKVRKLSALIDVSSRQWFGAAVYPIHSESFEAPLVDLARFRQFHLTYARGLYDPTGHFSALMDKTCSTSSSKIRSNWLRRYVAIRFGSRSATADAFPILGNYHAQFHRQLSSTLRSSKDPFAGPILAQIDLVKLRTN